MTEGWRKAVIVENKTIARGSKWIRLKAVDGYRITYEPGNVLSLGIPNQYGEIVSHPYTISKSDLEQGIFEHLYRVIPGGKFTPVLANLPVGSVINFRGIFHNPIIREISEGANAFIGISTGTGIGPLYGFAEKALNENILPIPITLYAGFRDSKDLCLEKELNELSEKYLNFSCQITFTNPPESWQGLKGRVTESVPQLLDDLQNTHYHLVGNGNMIGEMMSALIKAGVPKNRVTTESYFNHKGKLDVEEEIVEQIVKRFT